MERRRIFIVIAVLLITVAVVSCGLMLMLAAGLDTSYHSKKAFQTPAIRYFWVFEIFLFGVEIACLAYAEISWKSQRSLIPFVALFGAAILSIPAYMLGSAFTLDIPFSFSLNDERYEVPWGFGPDARADARGSYLRIRTSYPKFSSIEAKSEESGGAGVNLIAARLTSPDILCVGGVGCTSVVGEPRSTLPISQQLKDTISKHLRIDPSIKEFQVVRVQEAGMTTVYFYKSESGLSQSIYGLCTVESDYRICDYLFLAGKFYYSISVDFSKELPENRFQLERDIPLISVGIVELFNSFKKIGSQ